MCRWLSARTAQWDLLFATSLKEMLPPLERLGLPGQWGEAVFVSSDATTAVIGAIDWKFGCAFRERYVNLKPWVSEVLTDVELQEEGDEVVVHLAEMLSFVAFACARAQHWQRRMVVYAGDNMVVKNWLQGRKSRIRGGRILIRIINMLEMRWKIQVLAGWWRTYHNVDADYITRCTDEEFAELLTRKGWQEEDVKPAVAQALQDTRLFGPCFLYGADEQDRVLLMQLREKRMNRQLQKGPSVPWPSIRVVEWKSSWSKGARL